MEEPSLRQLRYLVSLAEHLHFGDAAFACGVSQPNLSAQIRELERPIEAQLVERTSRHVMLTATGEEVVVAARRVLREMDDLMDVASAQTDPMSGRLRLGVIPTIAPYVLPRVLPAVRKRWPDLELQLIEDFTDRLVPRLVQGELDLLLLALPIDNSGLHCEPLADEPFVVLTPRDHPLAKKTTISSAALDPADLLLLQEGHCLRDQALDLCHIPPTGRRQVVEGTSLNTLVQMVANGLGITLLPLVAVGVDAATTDEVRVLPFSNPKPGRTLGLVWREASARPNGFDELAGLLRKEIQRLMKTATQDLPKLNKSTK